MEAATGRIVVIHHVTLDGVMLGPGRPDEDTRDDFQLGGWAQRTSRPGDALASRMRAMIVAGGGLAGWLFGRRTQEDLLGH